MNILLSILTPAVPSRFDLLEKLCDELSLQIGTSNVEHLVMLDNKKRTVGEKRDALLRVARGEYITFVDDDDWVSRTYVDDILFAINQDPRPDVITFCQKATVNGRDSKIVFRLGSPNESFNEDGVTRRNAWHVCAWKRSLAILSHFPAINYGEDWAFAMALCARPNLREAHVNKVLHHYRHDARTTEAPAP